MRTQVLELELLLYTLTVFIRRSSAKSNVFGSEDIVKILDAHNSCRPCTVSRSQNKVKILFDGPRSSGTSCNVWDEKLASGAQEWAEELRRRGRCLLGKHSHSTFHQRERLYPDYVYVGENIATTWGSHPGEAGQRAVETLCSERRYFDISRGDGSVSQGCHAPDGWFKDWADCAHFTQIVWQETSAVGCGLARCPNGGLDNQFFVCHYNPGPSKCRGNFPEMRPFDRPPIGSPPFCESAADGEGWSRAHCEHFRTSGECERGFGSPAWRYCPKTCYCSSL